YKNYNVSRDPVLIKFYNSKEWRALRDYIMAVNYFLCIGCSVPGTKPVMADVVDHVVPVLVDWSLRLDPSNCEPLCHAFNNKKTKKDKKQYKIKKSRKIYFRGYKNGRGRSKIRTSVSFLTHRPSTVQLSHFLGGGGLA